MYIWDILLNSNSNFPCEHYFPFKFIRIKIIKTLFFLMKTFFYASNKLLLTKKNYFDKEIYIKKTH